MSLSWFSVHAIFGSVFGLLFTMNLHKYESSMKEFKKQGINTAELGLFTYRNSHQRCSVKKAALKNFATFAGKHPCWSLFSMKLQAWKPATLLKRDSNTFVFLWILQNLKNAYFEEQLQTAVFVANKLLSVMTIFRFHCSYRVYDQY